MQIIGIVFIVSLLVWVWHNRPQKFDREWRRVPPPDWAAKRGTGRIYW
jgi:hypothetical protein